MTAIVLDPAGVDAWRVRRQHLATPAASIEQVATDLVGVQAQVLSSAYLSIAIRTKNGHPDDVADAHTQRRLVRAWGMRGTLHVYAADHFPTIVAALSTRTGWRRPAWFRYFGVTEPEMDRLIEVIGEVLDDGVPRTRTELADAVTPHLGPTVAAHLKESWGTLLKPLVGQGLLCHGGETSGGVTFVRPDRWLGTWRTVDPIEARREILLAYLAAYGPATTEEVARWWGVAASETKRILLSMAADLTRVSIDGIEAWMGAADQHELASVPARKSSAVPRSVRLLGWFDPFIVGAGLRGRLIPKDKYTLVSRTSGWISPTVLVDGRVAGVWSSAKTREGVLVTIQWLDAAPHGGAERLETESKRLGRMLDAPVTLAYGTAHR
jgi:hypothetical protein